MTAIRLQENQYMNHTHHHPEPARATGTPLPSASLLGSTLPTRLAIAAVMAGIMWLTIVWSLG